MLARSSIHPARARHSRTGWINAVYAVTGRSFAAFGLATSVWTRDIAKAHRTAELMRSGTVWINCHNIFDASLPFGGFKQSGWGREMGHEALNLYTETKSVCVAL